MRVSTFRKDLTGIDRTIDDYIEFGMPIFERLAELRVNVVKPLASTIKRKAGCTLTKHGLFVEIELEHFVPISSKLELSIPKSNEKLSTLYDPADSSNLRFIK